MAFLDTTGLERLWQHIVAKIGTKADASSITDLQAEIDALDAGKSDSGHGHDAATTSAAGFMSASDKSKLNGIAAGAQVNTITGVKGNSESTYRTGDVNITAANIGLGSVNNTSDANKPVSTAQQAAIDAAEASALADAKSYANGLNTAMDSRMDAAESKLSGIAAGAEVNQNAFANVVVGTTTIAADAKSDSLKFIAGSNVTLTPNATDDSITIASTNTTYSAATTSAAGLMSPTDKSKLDGIESGAQKNTVTGVKGNSESSYRTGQINITKANIGLGNVDNTSDTNKPVSTAQQSAIDAAEAEAKSYTNTQINNLINASDDGVLNSITELADAIETNQDAISQLNSIADGKAPKSHASTATTYGIGTGSNYGHVKLSDATNSTSAASAGIAASPAAVKAAYDLAASKEVNQNAFSNVVVGDTTIAADTKTDSLTLIAGSNVTLTPNATNDSVTIAAKDTIYTHPSYTSKSNGLYKITVDGTGHVSGTSSVAKSDITALGIPAQDTTYSTATTSSNGLMSSGDKSKLNGIASGAEVNQNAFSNVVVGSTTIAADGKTDSITLAGSNVTLTPDATNDKVTIGITKANVTSALGYTPPTQDTTYSAASQSSAGLMSAADKTKLDGIATGANNYTYSLPVATSSVLGGVKSGGDVTISSAGVITVNDDSHAHVISNIDGLQSALDGKQAAGSYASSSHNHTGLQAVTTSGTGAAYTATVSGITSLTKGVNFIMIPHTSSTTTAPTLNVNGLGAKTIQRYISANDYSTEGYNASWLQSTRPVLVIYSGTYWYVQAMDKPAAYDLRGTVPIASGGTNATTVAEAVSNLGGLSVVASSTEPTNSNAMIWVKTS